MTAHELREAIATEAARLILRGKENQYHAARVRAARWLGKRRLSGEETPSNAEVQAKVESLACLFTDDQPSWVEVGQAALDALDSSETDEPTDDDYHPDTFPMLHLMMGRLEAIRLDPAFHPEGDALYHSLQVYELGLAERPYDEEFLLACLIHDIGLGIDRRHPVDAGLEAVGHLVTERTRFLIEHRPAAVEYLKTGRISRSLRKSEHFDDLVLLARFDLAGRVPGARVGTLEEALDHIAGVDDAWEDV